MGLFLLDKKQSLFKLFSTKLYLKFKKKINLFYSYEYQFDFNSKMFDSNKFKKIINKLRKEKLIKYKNIIQSKPLKDEDLELVHSKEYIDWIKRPLNLQFVLNTDYLTIFDEDIFNVFRYIAGGTYEAAVLALENKLPSFNLSGGYHHAKRDKGEGFCPINDIAISIKMLVKNKLIKKALIIDLDYHQGNGNRNIFKKDSDIFTFSIHAAQWDNGEAEASLDILINSDIEEKEYLKILDENLKIIDKNVEFDIIFYVSGSDPYIKDQLCDMKLSEETMLERDIRVFNFAKENNKALVILPAGGYGNESYRIYYNFIKWSILR